MTVSLYELTLYAWGMAALWVVPGPVWVALTARSLSGGFRGGLALGHRRRAGRSDLANGRDLRP